MTTTPPSHPPHAPQAQPVAESAPAAADGQTLLRRLDLPAPLNFAELPPHPHPQKHRRGLVRLFYAAIYSWHGLQAAVHSSAAFRMELMVAAPGVLAAFWLGQSWAEVVLLCGVMLLVLVVELLNSGIEAAIDRVSYDIHPLSKIAKDFGSAAVFLSMMLFLAVWGSLLYERLMS